jgi:excisionase family DNA binding protein
MLHVSRATVWRWAAEQGLKVVRVGNVTRIRESDLQTFLKCHESLQERGVKDGVPIAEAQN